MSALPVQPGRPWTPALSDLFARIEAHAFDPGDPLGFTRRLARDHGWTLLFAQAAVREYGRFGPVGILVGLLVLTCVLGALLLARPPHRNLAGAAARRDHARAARAPLPEEMALAFALTGSAVLAGRDYRWALASNGSSSSSDSGSSSGEGDGGWGRGGCSA